MNNFSYLNVIIKNISGVASDRDDLEIQLTRKSVFDLFYNFYNEIKKYESNIIYNVIIEIFNESNHKNVNVDTFSVLLDEIKLRLNGTREYYNR
jgi:hypothetical protein